MLFRSALYQTPEGNWKLFSKRNMILNSIAYQELSTIQIYQVFPKSLPSSSPIPMNLSSPSSQPNVVSNTQNPLAQDLFYESQEPNPAAKSKKIIWIILLLGFIAFVVLKKYFFVLIPIFIFQELQAKPFNFAQKEASLEFSAGGTTYKILDTEHYFIPTNKRYTFEPDVDDRGVFYQGMIQFSQPYIAIGVGGSYGRNVNNNGKITIPGSSSARDTHYDFKKDLQFITVQVKLQLSIFAQETWRLGTGAYVESVSMKGKHQVNLVGVNYANINSFEEKFSGSTVLYEPFVFWEFHLAEIWTLGLEGGYRMAKFMGLKRSTEVVGFDGFKEEGSPLMTYDVKPHGSNISGYSARILLRVYY